jgi:hypothetical protein
MCLVGVQAGICRRIVKVGEGKEVRLTEVSAWTRQSEDVECAR